MIYQKLNLRETPVDGFMPTMTTYIPYDSIAEEREGMKPRRRGAVVICPGGAYGFCSPREAEPIALHFCNAGYSAFVVDYCVAPIRYPEALKDVSEAIKLIRRNAEEWAIHPDQIVVCGFSAGGHLAASVGTLWNSEPAVRCENQENKPNGMILSYPVIMWGEKAHQGSFYNLLGENLSDADYEALSLEKRVGKDTPPAFIWHTYQDGAVPVENSLSFAMAMREQEIPFELHIYPKGEHGYSLATKEVSDQPDAHLATWADLAVAWMEQLFA